MTNFERMALWLMFINFCIENIAFLIKLVIHS